MMQLWDAKFMDTATAKMLGDRRFNYVPFSRLGGQQSYARAQYPHKSVGAKYDFIDEHYYYPVDKRGMLPTARARRVLAIPIKSINDDKYMASLGYTVNPSWKGASIAKRLIALARMITAGNEKA